MVSGDFCEHGWPGTGCKECRVEYGWKIAMTDQPELPKSADAESLDYVREIAQGLGYPSVLEALEALAEREAENARLREALVQHNDRLRSAIAVADREGKDTNWLPFRGQLHWTAAEYHDLVNEARKALETTDDR